MVYAEAMNSSASRPPERARLTSMGLAYALGAFNDHFFRAAFLLLAATYGQHSLQDAAPLLFFLPFALFSAWTGWLADRLPKKSIIVCSKALELAAMGLGLLSMYAMHWNGMMAAIFIMGLQSALFSPALNGSIPEIFPVESVPGVNALFKPAAVSALLLGIFLAGLLEALIPGGIHGHGRLAVGLIAMLASLAGLGAGIAMRRTPRPQTQPRPFPLFGPVDSLRQILACRIEDRPLFLALAGESVFYAISAFTALCIHELATQQMNLSPAGASLLSVSLLAGVCAGSLRAGRREAASWRRTLLPDGCGMAAGLLLASAAPLLPGTWPPFFFLLAVSAYTGFRGGLYLIPLASFIQIRPAAADKGRILGISNFAAFSGIIMAGLLFNLGEGLSQAQPLIACSLCLLCFLAWAARTLRELPDASLADRAAGLIRLIPLALISLRYRVRVIGLDKIPAGGSLLFMPNHPALIDPVIVQALLLGIKPRPLADASRMRGFLGRIAARVFRIVLIPDMEEGNPKTAVRGIREGLRIVIEMLNSGESAIFYPAGRILRSSTERLGNNSGAARLLAACPETRIILARSSGLWGSSFSYAGTGRSPDFARELLRGLLALAGNCVLLTPRREVLVEFVEATDLPRDGNKKELNRRLENFYRGAERPPLAVPRFFWRKRCAKQAVTTESSVAPRIG
ncbi:MAG: MFS transporter [Desulfovibrionaceae bacterium]|nr:MFS transporter [Desulfovibrionaceae bacterium]